MRMEEAIRSLENGSNVKFADLLKICETFFGKSRVRGSHFIFKTPWKGRLNIQKDKKMAKKYQVKQVFKALEKLQQREAE